MSVINKTTQLSGGYTATKAKVFRFDSIFDENQEVVRINAHYYVYKDADAVTSNEAVGDRSQIIELKDENGDWVQGWDEPMDDAETLSWIESQIHD